MTSRTADRYHDIVEGLLNEFGEFLFFAGDGPSSFRCAIHGSCFVNEWRSRAAETLPLAKRTLADFCKRATDGMPGPPPVAAAWLVADKLTHHDGSVCALLAAALLLIGVDAYWRPGEALDLRIKDLTPPRGQANSKDWAVTFCPAGGDKPAKNQEFDSGVVLGAFGRRYVNELLSALVLKRAAGSRLFGPLTLPILDKLVSQHRHALPFDFTPHGIRHAGPSHDMYFNKAQLDWVQARARWKALESCRRYAKPAALLRRLKMLTDEQLKAAAELEKTLAFVLARRFREVPRAVLEAEMSAADVKSAASPSARSSGRKRRHRWRSA